MAQFTEEEKMLRRIDKRFSKGVVEYGLIEDGDKILIGLSGGKDSLALVELLARRARVYKPVFRCRRTCSDEEYTLSKRCGLSEGVRRVVGSAFCSL